MSSSNKKAKMKNCYGNHGFDLKNSTIKLKRLLYFNASIRQKNNKIKIEDE